MDFFERMAQAKIEEAVRRGEFDGLTNAGLKINYQEYLEIPVAQRMMLKLMRDARVVPREIELLNEIYALQEKLRDTELSAGKRASLAKELGDKKAEKDLRMAILARSNE